MTHRIGLCADSAETISRLETELGEGLDAVEFAEVPAEAPAWEGYDCVVAWVDEGATQEQLHQLAIRADDTRLLLIVDRDDCAEAVRAVHCGAHDFVSRPYRKRELVAALSLALDPDADEAPSGADVDALRERFAGLSEREREVVDMMMQGNCNETIAERLDLAPKTVAIHIANVRQKMDAPSLGTLARQISSIQHSPA